MSLLNANKPSPPVGPLLAFSAFVGVHRRRLYCFCMVRVFRVFFAAFCLHTWRNCESLSWVMCVYPPRGPRGDPITPPTERPALACGDFQSGRALEKGHTSCAAFQQSGPALAALRGEGGGGLVGRAMQCFQKHRLLAASLNMMEKNACC